MTFVYRDWSLKALVPPVHACLYSCLYQFCFNLYSRVCLNTRLNGVKSILFEFQFHTRWSKEEAEIYLFNANFAVSYLFLQI